MNNPIKHIDENFMSTNILGNLNEFSIDNFTISINISIKTEYYQSNKIIKMINSNYFNEMPNLKLIQMRSNQIESIENDAFTSLPNLTSLDLRDNKLVHVHFQNMFNLNLLDLSNNSIEIINLINLNNLKELNLNDNNISYQNFNFKNFN